MTWSAEVDNRLPPESAEARRQAELCMLMVGHALHDLYENSADAAAIEQREQDLLLLVTRALQLNAGEPDEPT